MRSLLAQLRAFWRGLRSSTVDADMQDEMRFHIEMETQRMQARGIDPGEAARRAAVAFGGVEKYRGAGRDALGLTWLRGLSTDFKLGSRMLARYPGLTIVAVFALSLAIGAGAAFLEFSNTLMNGALPFADADRIVGIQMRDQGNGRLEKRLTADFVRWRESVRSMESLAAYRALDRNMVTADGRAEPVHGIQVTASAFTIARVPPVLGRVLHEADERAGAPPVVVIGHDVWTTRFASAPEAIGQTIRLGSDTHIIVGVMPEGFGLPISHSLWVPLPLNDAFSEPREGPATGVFGKLTASASLKEAQAEFDALAARAATDQPNTHRHLYPVVAPYVPSLWSSIDDAGLQTMVVYAVDVFLIGLLALCGANVATLVFARTVTRETEISVRTALGASRSRIAGQLFVEALVLSAAAAGVGLTVASYSMSWIRRAVANSGEPIWFWWRDGIGWSTIGYGVLLAVGAALIVGVVPALKATGARIQDRLKQATGATSGALRFGGVWTAVIVAQIAVTVIFFAVVGMLGWSAFVTGGGKRAVHAPATEYVTARLTVDREQVSRSTDTTEQILEAYGRQVRASYLELSRRLAVEPSIASVTYGTRLPVMDADFVPMDIDGVRPPPGVNVFNVRTVGVAINFFEAFEAPVVAGRNFSEGDLAPDRHAAIVDRTFVRRFFTSDHAAIGRQLRVSGVNGTPAGPWIEIVGVVADLTDDTNKRPGEALLYRPIGPEAANPFYLAMRARSSLASATSRMRILAVDADPMLRLNNVMTLDRLGDEERAAIDFFARTLAGVSIVAIILATAGVYALMSFTVSRRTAEIGIRIALGANPRRVVWGTFSRALAQVAVGLILGSIPAGLIVWVFGPEVAPTNGSQVAIVTGVMSTLLVALMAALASLGPARRALRIQPTDALKAE